MSDTETLNIVLDRDCPACDWPELIAEGTTAGPERLACRKCGWSETVMAS